MKLGKNVAAAKAIGLKPLEYQILLRFSEEYITHMIQPAKVFVRNSEKLALLRANPFYRKARAFFIGLRDRH